MTMNNKTNAHTSYEDAFSEFEEWAKRFKDSNIEFDGLVILLMWEILPRLTEQQIEELAEKNFYPKEIEAICQKVYHCKRSDIAMRIKKCTQLVKRYNEKKGTKLPIILIARQFLNGLDDIQIQGIAQNLYSEEVEALLREAYTAINEEANRISLLEIRKILLLVKGCKAKSSRIDQYLFFIMQHFPQEKLPLEILAQNEPASSKTVGLKKGTFHAINRIYTYGLNYYFCQLSRIICRQFPAKSFLLSWKYSGLKRNSPLFDCCCIAHYSTATASEFSRLRSETVSELLLLKTPPELKHALIRRVITTGVQDTSFANKMEPCARILTQYWPILQGQFADRSPEKKLYMTYCSLSKSQT